MKMHLALKAVLLMGALSSRPVQCNANHLYDTQHRALAGLSELVWLDPEWLMVFRISSGAYQSAYDAYMDRSRDDDLAMSRAFLPLSCLQPYSQNFSCCRQHYRSGLLTHWPSNYIDEVKVSVVKGGQEVAYITFNGKKSTALSWFSPHHIIDSSWVDLKTEPHNVFGITGDTNYNGRRFSVYRNYGTCATDAGWLNVQDQVPSLCPWEQPANAGPFPGVQYCRKKTFCILQSEDFVRADTLVVAVKFRWRSLVPHFC